MTTRSTGNPVSSAADLKVADTKRGAAGIAGPLIESLVGQNAVRFEFWDRTTWGPDTASGTIFVRSSDSLRRLVWAPSELGVARAFIVGDIDIEGDLFDLVAALRPAGLKLRTGLVLLPRAVRAAHHLGALGWPLPPPPEEARPRGRRHSIGRDAAAVGYHYDVGNDFYRVVLGSSMTYSCARFASPDVSLSEAQASKHDLVCRKLGLHERPGQRLLDVGCGWGSMAMHAAERYGARVVGVTISQEQAEHARRRVEAADLSGLVDIRLCDYRDLTGERFDAISSIGMAEHVGHRQLASYFSTLASFLVPGGRLLNHAISSVGGSKIGSRTFIYRYVFPDGELLDVGDTVLAMEAAGLEVRDVESLREHYATTLRRWVANLDQQWDEAVALVGPRRARVWRLYMAASAIGFEDGGLSLHQVLGVIPAADGSSGMPSTRDDWSISRCAGESSAPPLER